MLIGSVIPSSRVTLQAETPQINSEQSSTATFQDKISSAIDEVSDLQKKADQAALKVPTGGLEDIHGAMLAMGQANLALQFTVQVRNKIIEAYQEIMRMQV